ncbi:MAG: MFS transporter, partial [Candidatus Eremiobacterota bacterium]
FSGVAMPFLLRQAGVEVETIAVLGALALLPAGYQLFWAPVLDLGFRRRQWLVLVSFLGALCLGASMLLELPRQLLAFKVLLLLGSAFTGLVASCNGALVSTTLPENQRGRAAGWVNAANLGAAVLGGGVVISLATAFGTTAAAAGLALMLFLPSLAALTIPEPPPRKEPLLRHVGTMGRDVWKAVRARRGWTGLLFCISPVGTVALMNLFAALGPDFDAPPHIVAILNGYAGGFVTAAGALLSGYLLDRVDKRAAYIASGILSALVAIFMALGPLNTPMFVVGSLLYLFVAGLAYTAFSAVVYEIVGTAGSTAATLYSVFPAAGNQAIAYVMLLDGAAHKLWGTRGLLATDAALNLVGVCALLLLLRVVFPERVARPAGELEPALQAA